MGVIRPNSFSGSAACATPTPTSLRSVDPPHKGDYPALDWRAFAVEALFEGQPPGSGRAIEMDISTRIGLGGSALFTVASFSQPLFGWWVAGPAMAFSAAVAVWGFWPLRPKRIWPFNYDNPIEFHYTISSLLNRLKSGGNATVRTTPRDT